MAAEVVVGEPVEVEPTATAELDLKGRKVEVYRPTEGFLVALQSLTNLKNNLPRQIRALNRIMDAVFVKDDDKDYLLELLTDMSNPDAFREIMEFLQQVISHWTGPNNREERRAAARTARPARKVAGGRKALTR